MTPLAFFAIIIPMFRDGQRPPSEKEVFYSLIPQLVKESLRPGKSSRRSLKELLQGIDSDPQYNPTFLAFRHLQTELLSNDPKTVHAATDIMWEIFSTTDQSVKKAGGKTLTYSSSVREAATAIIKNDKSVQKSTFVSKKIKETFPISYANHIRIAQSVVEGVKRGEPGTFIASAPVASSVKERRQRERDLEKANAWIRAVQKSQGLDLEEDIKTQADNAVDLIKTEPSTPFTGGGLTEKTFAGISLKDIEKIAYPPTQTQLSTITRYVREALEAFKTNPHYHYLISKVFFSPIFFRGEKGPIALQNRDFLKISNAWQEAFLHNAVFGTTELETTKAIFTHIRGMGIPEIVLSLQRWTAYAAERDPEFTGDNLREIVEVHPFQNAANADYLASHPNTVFMYSDEVGLSYFYTTVLPRFEERLAEFGLLEKFREALDIIKADSETRFAIDHLETMTTFFKTNCTEAVLRRLDTEQEEIQQNTTSAWEQIFERDAHFLPMRLGFNVVEFPANGFPEMLGLKRIMVNVAGDPSSWHVNIIYNLKNSDRALYGTLDQNGKIQWRAPLEETLPGIHAVLNFIAVATFHDLAVQEQKKDRVEERKGGSTRRRKESKIRTTKTQSGHTGSLPRTQSAETLINDVYKATGHTPRRVELHKAYLRGTREYEEAVKAYSTGIEIDSPATTKAERLRIIALRNVMYKPSEKKVKTVPARYRLKEIIDPITGDTYFLETWVVEHTSPKPNEEELRNPRILFERHYRRSSSLAFLDQMKPWFIEE